MPIEYNEIQWYNDGWTRRELDIISFFSLNIRDWPGARYCCSQRGPSRPPLSTSCWWSGERRPANTVRPEGLLRGRLLCSYRWAGEHPRGWALSLGMLLSLEVEDGHIGEVQPGGLPLHRGGGTSANIILESVQRLIGFSTVFRMDLVDSCTRWQLWMSVIQDTGSSISTNLPNLISFFVFLLCVWLCVLFDYNVTACSTRLPYKQDISRGFGWKADRNKISVVRFVWSNPSQTEGQLTEPHQWQGPASYCHPHSLTDWDAICSTRCTYYNTIILLSNGQAKHLRSLAIQNIWYQLISLINGLT